jgi:hypothetical protein
MAAAITGRTSFALPENVKAGDVLEVHARVEDSQVITWASPVPHKKKEWVI